MCVLVRVDMRDVKPCPLQALYLGHSFVHDFIGPDAPSQHCRHEREQGRAKAPVIFAKKARNQTWLKDRDTIRENDVTTDPQVRMLKGEVCRGLKGRACSHKRCRAQGTRKMQFEDRAVHTGSEAEIICVDEKAARHVRGTAEHADGSSAEDSVCHSSRGFREQE